VVLQTKKYDTSLIVKQAVAAADERPVLVPLRYGGIPGRIVSYHRAMDEDATGGVPGTRTRGRPRSDATHRRILLATRDLLMERTFADLRIEHVAARAGVSKAAIYRRWPSKEALAQELLAQLAGPHIAIADVGNTRAELLACVINPMRAVTDTPFGPVIRSLLSQIATNPTLGDPFRATVVQARRDEIARVIERGIARGDLRRDADTSVATELLVGPVYFRVMFGGPLDGAFAERVVDAVLHGFGSPPSEGDI
jgi:AcrR family transcriptional regulator